MRTLVISDIHSNLEALQAALEVTDFQRVFLLGDLVGYGAEPNEVIDAIVGLGPALKVRGNHDKVCSGLEEPDGFSDAARAASLWTRARLTASSREYLRRLPKGPVPGDDCLLSHGSPRDEDEYIVSEQQVWEQMPELEERICFFGHTHVPMVYIQGPGSRESFYVGDSLELPLRDDCKYFLNPGSVGQPRDGDWRGSLIVLDGQSNKIEFHKFEYPVAAAADKILDRELPEGLAHRLYYGR